MSGAGAVLFESLGDGRFVPSDVTRGPWDPGAQHGGAPAALVARVIEAAEPGAQMRVARVTLELLRPVPLAELHVDAEIVRPGRRVQLVEATVRAAGDVVARAVALRIRRGEPGAAEPPPPRPAAEVGPADAVAEPFPFGELGPSFGSRGVEIRFARGGWAPGPVFAWIALRASVVEGEEPTGLQRAMAAADFGNGVSSVLDWSEHLFVNPDLTVHLQRDPVGEWIGLDARTVIGDDGTGQAESALHDESGRFGSAVQALYVAVR